jgi:DNA-binding CsgD family transcriptional regulator
VRLVLCPTLVGRQAELDMLVGLHDARHGGAAFVLGEAGIGKSRLVSELADRARARGVLVLAGRAVEARQPMPYRPLAEAMAVACRRIGLPNAAELIPYRPALGRLIPEWRRPGLANSAESAVVLGEGVLRMLRVLGGDTGVLMIVEDAHWADVETVEVLEYLIDHAAEERLTCIATCRPEPGPGLNLLHEQVRRRTARLLKLAPLSTAAVATMAQECLGAQVLPSGLDGLLSRAEGVPLLVEELLAAAVESGGLTSDGDGWAVRPEADDVVPETMSDAVAQRVMALDSAAGLVPATAALLGSRIDPDLVGVVLGRTAADVVAVLESCSAMQLVVYDEEGYRFRHALTRDAVLAALPAGTRMVLARRALAAIVSSHPDLPGRLCQLAAELALTAGEVDDAAQLLLAASRRMVADGALTTAGAVLAQARGLEQDDSELAIELDEMRTEVAALAGEVSTAFEVGGRLLERMTDRARLAQLRVRLAQAASAATQWTAAEEQLASARELTDDEALVARIDALAAHVLLGAARRDDAEASARRALAVAERLDLAEPACEALEVLGRIARTRNLQEAEAAFARQAEIASMHGLVLWVVRATHELGGVDLLAGAGRQRLLKARELAAQAGALMIAATVDLQLSASHWIEFDVPASITAAQRCQQAARRWNHQLMLAEALVNEARGHATAGDRPAMERAISEAAALDQFGQEVEGSAWAARGLYALLREDRAGAIAAYDTAVSIGLGLPTVYVRPYSSTWAFLRTVIDDGGDQARAKIRPLVPVGSLLAQAQLEYGEAIALGRDGLHDAAETAFSTARAALRTGVGLQAQRHLAERLVAECALVDAWGAPVDWLTEAAAFFYGTGHAHVERGCRSLLRRAGARLPRRERGHRHVPPALAALGVTDREADVLALVVEGLTSKEIATQLYISARTVDKHIERLLSKTGASRRGELRKLGT